MASHVRFAWLIVTALGPFATAGADDPPARAVAFQTSDGLLLSADYYPPARKDPPAPVAILLHGHRQDRSCWEPLINPLHAAGFAVLCLDLRGHGESRTEATVNRMADRDPGVVADLHRDLRAAYDWITTQPEIDRARFALIGADLGGAAALRYATRDRSVDCIVCLTPALETMGIDTRSDVPKLRGRDVLLVSARSDAEASAASAELVKLAPQIKAQAIAAADRGAELLTADPRLATRIADFVRSAVGKPSRNIVVGTIDNHVYHLPGSGWIERMNPSNVRLFSSPQEAEARGVRKSFSAGPASKDAETPSPKKGRP